MSSRVHIPMPAGFLSLAPTTSSSFPAVPKPKVSSTSSTPTSEPAALPLTTTALAQVPAAPPVAEPKNRTQSLSSDGSNKSGAGLRFLKLGPVHQGEHLDGKKGDWHDLAVE